MIICNSCGGTYEGLQKDMRYAHVCPDKIRDKNGAIVDTPNPRNENVEGSIIVDGDKITNTLVMKSEGKGAKYVNDGTPYDLLSTITAK